MPPPYIPPPRAGLSPRTRTVHALLSVVLAARPIVGIPIAAASSAQVGTLGHGGDQPAVPRTPLKLFLDLCSIAALVLLGGVFAGLTLGLMGLDMVNLQVLSSSGTEMEQKHAKVVLNLLAKGRHWVLVVLLLGNVIVNETLPVFLSDFGGGLSAVLTSTLLIVIFGEIVPQAVCARYGLSIGAYCAPMVHAVMVLLAPIAWPTAKLLDWCLGEDQGTVYRKAELKTFVSLHKALGEETLTDDEVSIIRAVLDLNDKTLSDIMTPIEDVFTLPSDAVLDEAGVDTLVHHGYSRIPVHEPGKPDAVLGMLLVKNLITYDPEDAEQVSRFHLAALPEASPDLTLFDCLNYFQQGRSHMLLVSDHPGEPRGARGVVTLEDLIEEMIGREIVDETDVYLDVHNKVKVARPTAQPSGHNRHESWQPLIRGIIERRRNKLIPSRGRSTYGLPQIGTRDNSAQPQGTPLLGAEFNTASGYGTLNSSSAPRVQFKRMQTWNPEQPHSGRTRRGSAVSTSDLINVASNRQDGDSKMLSTPNVQEPEGESDRPASDQSSAAPSSAHSPSHFSPSPVPSPAPPGSSGPAAKVKPQGVLTEEPDAEAAAAQSHPNSPGTEDKKKELENGKGGNKGTEKFAHSESGQADEGAEPVRSKPNERSANGGSLPNKAEVFSSTKPEHVPSIKVDETKTSN